jgi:hypothetical protein
MGDIADAVDIKKDNPAHLQRIKKSTILTKAV